MKISPCLILLGVLLVPRPAPAQSFSIDRFVIGSGGGTSTGARFAVTGTTGQPDSTPQPLIGGNFSLSGGFWALSAVPASGAPLLSISRHGGDAQISWPLTATGFVLDQSFTITGPWSQVAFPYETNGATIRISLPSPAGNRFFRLHKPE